MIQEHTHVALTRDLAQQGLRAGDVGVVVFVHDGGAAYEVEFMTLEGRTIGVETLEAAQVRVVGPDEIANARLLAG